MLGSAWVQQVQPLSGNAFPSSGEHGTNGFESGGSRPCILLLLVLEAFKHHSQGSHWLWPRQGISFRGFSLLQVGWRHQYSGRINHVWAAECLSKANAFLSHLSSTHRAQPKLIWWIPTFSCPHSQFVTSCPLRARWEQPGIFSFSSSSSSQELPEHPWPDLTCANSLSAGSKYWEWLESTFPWGGKGKVSIWAQPELPGLFPSGESACRFK